MLREPVAGWPVVLSTEVSHLDHVADSVAVVEVDPILSESSTAAELPAPEHEVSTTEVSDEVMPYFHGQISRDESEGLSCQSDERERRLMST